MTAWSSAMSHDTEAESRTAKAYRAVSTFWTQARHRLMNGLLEQVPRWFLLALVVVLLPASTTFGTFSFHFAMYYLAEAKAANEAPVQQEIAGVISRVSKLESRVAAIEMELPPLAKKVDKIDTNVEKLVARRGGR